MSRITISQRINQLEARKKALQARLGKQERAHDTRRKILLGALILHRLETGNDRDAAQRLREWLQRELPTFLTRDGDQALFTDLLGQAGKDHGAGERAP